MATVKAVSSKVGIGGAINYVSKAEKTESKLLSGINCQPDTALQEMMLTKELWGKTEGRAYMHFTQSFHKKENISHEQAHEIALKFASKIPAWEGHEVLIATHKDREHIHTHFIVNSVNAMTGKKLQSSKSDLASMKQESDKLCLEYGLTVCEKGKTFEGASRTEPSTYTKEAYRIINQSLKNDSKGDFGHSEGATDVKVESYVLKIKNAVLEAKSEAKSRCDFEEMMKSKGIKVNWTDKKITFIDIAREKAGEKKCRIRNSRLEKIFNMDFSGASLELEFQKNLEKENAMQHQSPEHEFDDPTELESNSAPVIDEGIADSEKNPEIRKPNFKTEPEPQTPSEKKIEQIKSLMSDYDAVMSDRSELEMQKKSLRLIDRKKKKQISEQIKSLDYKALGIQRKLEKLGVEYVSDVPKVVAELEAKIPKERAEIIKAQQKKSAGMTMGEVTKKIEKEKQENPEIRKSNVKENEKEEHKKSLGDSRT